ncbi:MAG: aminotransferase class IV [Parachlamydiaceae bacterium]
MSEKWVFLNDSFRKEKEAFIPIGDRGFLFGDGLFTTIRVNHGQPEFVERHLKRLQRHAESLDFNLDCLQVDFITELINLNQAQEGIWRLKIIVTVVENEEKRELGILLATLEPAQDFSFHSCILTLFPHPIERPLGNMKSLAYLDHLHVRNYAKRLGYTDAIKQTREGVLMETGCSNLFWIDKGKCLVPDPTLPYLKGVFLESLLPYFSWPVEHLRVSINELPPTAHLYICNALSHIRPVVCIDQRSFLRCEETEHQLRKAIVQSLQGND